MFCAKVVYDVLNNYSLFAILIVSLVKAFYYGTCCFYLLA